MSESRNQAGRVTFIILMLVLGIGGYLLFSTLSGQQTSIELHNAYRSLALNMVLVGAAMAAGNIPSLFLSPSTEEKLEPAILAVSYTLAGFGLWRGLNTFSQSVYIVSRIGIVCFVIAISIAVSYLAIYAQRRNFGGVFSGIFNWLVNSRFLFIIITAVGTIYAVMIRPAFMGTSVYSVLLEWIIIILLGIIIFSITRFQIGRSFTSQMITVTEWREHRQQRESKADADFTQLRNISHHFVENNDAVMLAHFLVSLLAQNEAKEIDIARILDPLFEYRTQSKSNSKQTGRAEREALLKMISTEIQSIVQPPRYTRYTSSQTPVVPIDAEESQTISGLARDFCNNGNRSRLLVRLSLDLTKSGTRTEDIEEMLIPLVNYVGNQRNGRPERERLWRDIVSRAAYYAPKLSIKE
jgi:hypothetical protein